MSVLAKRLLALIALILAAFFSLLGISAPTAYGVAFVVVLWVLLDGLCQPISSSALYLLCYENHGHFFKRALVFLFSPGWASSALFSLLIFYASLKLLQWEEVSKEPLIALIFISSFAATLWPAALIRFLFPQTPYFFTFYFLFQLIGGTLAFLIYGIPEKANGLWDVLICFAPSAVFFLATKQILPATGVDIYLWMNTLLCYLSVLLLFVRILLISMDWPKKR